MRRLAYLLAVLSVAVCAEAQSISGVSGTFQHGQTITITGSSLGTKSPVAPFCYEDTSTVTLNATILTSSACDWNSASSQVEPIASNLFVRSGTPGTQNWLSRFESVRTSGDWSTSNAHLNDTFTVVLVDAHRYTDTSAVTDKPFPSDANFKHIRIHHDDADDAPNIGITDAGPDSAARWCLAGDGRANPGTGQFSDYASFAEIYDAWMHHGWLLDVGSGGAAEDGRARCYVNGELRATSDALSLLNTGIAAWNLVYIGNYIRNDSEWTGTIRVYWDSVYIDKTWARVVISNNATFANITNYELCVPHTTWDGSTITCTFKRGGLTVGGSVYVHVCIASGACTAGNGPHTVAADSGSPASGTAPGRFRRLRRVAAWYDLGPLLAASVFAMARLRRTTTI